MEQTAADEPFDLRSRKAANGMVDYISGADELGMYTGKYDKADDSLIFSYISRSQNVLVLTFNLKRKS
ncbi:MAG: hypothetical protein HQ468_00230 [Actinomycetales bacterium]|nr:hypothetical protein [Actinomycetales bacterium]